MIEKAKTALWFLQRPSFWPFMLELGRRRLTNAYRHEAHYPEAEKWAAAQAVSVEQALDAVGIKGEGVWTLPDNLLSEAQARAEKSGVEMGGPGDLQLIHKAVGLSGAKSVIETGVAYGWSSLAALAALRQTDGRLVSVDMPYPKAGNEEFVGIVVPQEWRNRWTLIRRPDRNGIKHAIAAFGGTIDLAHYDSDKSYVGRMYALPLLWAALRPGGLLICDDIQDNFGFRDFASKLAIPFAITESDGKFVGLLRKPC